MDFWLEIKYSQSSSCFYIPLHEIFYASKLDFVECSHIVSKFSADWIFLRGKTSKLITVLLSSQLSSLMWACWRSYVIENLCRKGGNFFYRNMQSKFSLLVILITMSDERDKWKNLKKPNILTFKVKTFKLCKHFFTKVSAPPPHFHPNKAQKNKSIHQERRGQLTHLDVPYEHSLKSFF